MAKDNTLGVYLRDRRGKLDPASFGFQATRRRTPGLRREEVAQRANVSTTWYTWLEQGRGGAPSPEVLDRLAYALTLTDSEREYLFVLATGRPPAPSHELMTTIAPRLQRVLDSMDICPALIKNCAWDIVAWNQAAALMFPHFSTGNDEDRNVLRKMFSDPNMRFQQDEWQKVARYVVAAFRADAARAGFDVIPLVTELSERYPEFAALWEEKDIFGRPEHTKFIHHPKVGAIEFDLSAFAVDGRTDLNLVIYTPANENAKKKLQSVIASSSTLSLKVAAAVS